MIGIEWPAVFVARSVIAASLYLGLGRVVTHGAQALKVIGIEEQITVATVRPDVIDDRGRDDPIRVHAETTEGFAV